MLVWDISALYHLRAIRNPELAALNAPSLLVWEAIHHGARLGVAFDSDSFQNRAGALFLEGFGAERAQHLTVSRRSLPLRLAEAVEPRLTPR